MSHRLEKVNDQIRAKLSEILHREYGPAWGLISVSRVATSPDLQNCRVFVSIFSTKISAAEAVKQLNYHQGRLRTALAAVIRLKYTPALYFLLDDSSASAARIEKIIQDLR
jgi:ribosome-binding factor A